MRFFIFCRLIVTNMPTIKIEDCIVEIEEKLLAAVDLEKVTKIKDLKKYIGTKLNFIGLSVPQQREVFAIGYSWNDSPIKQQFSIWDKVWKKSTNYEVINQALFFYSKNRQLVNPQELWNTLKLWVIKVDNWAHSDSLSDLYSYLLERESNHIYPDLVTWNTSQNPWERRQSLVSLMEYSKKRKQLLPVNKMLPLVKNLLNDQDIFVQKAVGWSLREIGNAYPADTLRFLNKHCKKISAVAFSAAIEKLNAEQKNDLKTLRKR